MYAYVYSPEQFKNVFNTVAIAEAVQQTGKAYVYKVAYEPQWV